MKGEVYKIFCTWKVRCEVHTQLVMSAKKGTRRHMLERTSSIE